MDPVTGISLVAGIAQLIGVTTKTIKYLNNVKDAPKDRAKLIQEASSLLALLTNLNYTLEGANTTESWLGTVHSQGMKDVLDQLQRSMEELAKKLKPEQGMKKLSKRIVWTLDKKEIMETLAKIERVKSLVGLALQRDHIRLSLAIKADITDVNANVCELGNNVLAITDGVTALQINQKDQERRDAEQRLHEERQAAVAWLSHLNFSSKQIDVFSQQQEGTGTWFLNTDAFKRWFDGNERMLWCPGLPGAGKTILASTVINRLQCTYSKRNIGIAFIYCDYKEQEQQTPVNLMSSLLQQLVEQQPVLPDEVRSLWKEHTRQRTRPGLAELSKLFQSTASRFSKIFIVVDALDETRESSEVARDLITEIQKLPPTLCLMGTSRHKANIEQLFRGSVQLEIQANDADIRAYIRIQINRRERLKKFVQADPSLPGKIETKIASKAQGMFLLARLHIESLGEKHDRKAVRLALERLPEKLNETYDEALKRIKRQNEHDILLAQRILTWISFATRPLKVEEMQHAIAVMNLEPEENYIEEDGLPDKDILLNVCAGIVIIDKESDIIRLVHYTTQEYFEQKRFDLFPKAQAEIAKACLTYLSLDTFMDGPCSTNKAMENRLQNNPLLHYAAGNWGVHAQGPPEKVLSTDIIIFLRTSKATECAIQVSTTAETYRHEAWSQNYPSYVPAIAYAASVGLTEIVGYLLNEECDINASGSNGKTALHLAAEDRHEALIKLLLEHSADINSKDSDEQTALSRAAERGYEAVIKLLLEHGAKINSKDSYGWTALSWAARYEHEAVIKLLLEHGAEINSKDKYGWTVLSWAAVHGHEAVIKLLLEHGAEINSKDKYGWSALSRAAGRGHEAVIKLLLEHGAEINSKDSHEQTALSRAAECGYKAVIKLLLEHGAEINSKDSHERTALLRAAECGHEAVIKLLLEHGAEINSKDSYGWTALSWAARHGHEAVIKLLLEHGAEINSKDKYGWSALSRAAGCGYKAVIKLLLEHGAEINSKDKYGQTVLSWAAERGYKAVIKLLLEHGAKINSKDNCGQSALSRAAERGHEAVIKLLLEHGAKINSKDNCGQSALSRAAERGHEAVIKLLLEHGAEINSKDKYGQTVLSWAAERGYKAVIKLLLEHGAEINSKDNCGQSALSRAAERGHEAVIKLLQEYGAEIDEIQHRQTATSAS